MQTFLPYPDFSQSAAALDRQRLGKQRVEAFQILRTLTAGGGWAHHPAVRMWASYESALKLYANAMIEEWVRRGYRNNMPLYELDRRRVELPWWLGIGEFHAAHRAALLAKNYAFYAQYGWTEEPRISYLWFEGSK